jgi:hypothetical protein
MALTPEEKEQLDKLTQKANEPDDDDFEIEIWDGTGAGAKVPYHKGKTWLQRFGIDLPDTPEDDTTEGKKPAKKTPAASGDDPGTAGKYFGPRKVS